MKAKILFLFCIATIVLSSCTSNTRARNWGGNKTIELPKGKRLIEVTWKDNSSLWYLTEDMDSTYVPKTKYFQEESRFGVMEGCVKFVESK